MAKAETDKQQDTAASNKSLRPLSRLIPYLSRYKGMVSGALMALVSAAVFTLVLPTAVRQMIDRGFGGDNPEVINSYFGLLLGVVAALSLASAIRYYLVMWIGERVVANVRSDVFSHMTELSPAFYDKSRSGEILSRLTADTTQIKSAFGATASLAMRNLVLFIGAVIMMLVTSPHLSIIVLAAIPLILLPLILFGRNVRQRSRTSQDTLANAAAYAGEMLSNIRSLQSFVHEREASKRFASAAEGAFQAARKATGARAILTFFAIFIIGSSVVAVLWIGSNNVLSGTMTGGELSQFLLYSILAASSLAGLSEVWGELSLAAGAAERLSELLEVKPQIAAPIAPMTIPELRNVHLSFQDTSFSYETADDKPVLHEISLTIQGGETIAIVGPSGAGKSTLFHLLMRFYDPTTGRISMNDVKLKDVDPKDLRQRIALVPQDAAIFAATIADNIAYGKPGASAAEIEAAARAASAHDFITAMTDGYQTMAGERGVTLSGGQKQRIAIARAILKDAPVLLLDEATSALDAESEHLVQSALDQLMQGRTTLVIAHRLATVLKADRIVVMEAGRIVDIGTHSELVARKGLYAKLAQLQFDAGASTQRQTAS
ncbi:ABC transporter transmembrane domain-containing protein [Roseibium algae]|uniref:ABC transporter transmembrane domain-containing protein n=1 Tax=Roseibium algae TaxID=3123038 RepID=A0ABU8TH50_9HYPH